MIRLIKKSFHKFSHLLTSFRLRKRLLANGQKLD